MRGGICEITPSQLLGNDLNPEEKSFSQAKDPVIYCYFSGGGLISYRKSSGYIHTLCDEFGMRKKMDELLNGDNQKRKRK
jgi:hypothetical protein